MRLRDDYWIPGAFAASLGIAYAHSLSLAIRGVQLGPDVQLYYWRYEGLDGGSEDPIWTLLQSAGHALRIDFTLWLTLLLTLQSGLWMLFSYHSCRLLGMQRDSAALSVPLMLLLTQTYPFLEAGQTNIIRAGLATPLGALGVARYARRGYLACAILLLAAVGVHRQVGAILIIGLLGYMLVPRRPAIALFAALSGLYAFGIATAFAQLIVPDRLLQGALEYGLGLNYRTGVRFDFLAFTALQLLVVALLARRDPEDAFAGRSVAWMVGLSAPFLLVGGIAAFSDRWLQSYWCVAPVLAVLLVFRMLPQAFQHWLALTSAALACAVTILEFSAG